LSVQIEQFQAFKLYIAAVIVIDPEYLEDSFVVTYGQVFPAGGELTRASRVGELYGVNQSVASVL
jgi:hypothetical protein